MKIQMKFLIYGLIYFAVMSLSGCKEEYKTTTKINDDGSCERIIIAKIDSARLLKGAFLVPHDNSWKPEYKTLSRDTQKVFIVHKNFDDVNKINDEYKDSDKVGIEIKFEKKFRWFFSYLTYTETYKSYNRFNRIPVESFLTKEEYGKLESGDTGKVLSKKLDKFMEENLFEEFFQQFVSKVKDKKDSPVSMDLLDEKKNELRDSLLAGSGEIKSILRSMKNVFKSENIKMYEPDIEEIMKDINSKLERMSGIEGDYTNEVIMPGIILNTNANTLEGNKASWKFNQDRFCFIDHVMSVESRITNIWATYVTGAFFLIIVILLLITGFRKSKTEN